MKKQIAISVIIFSAIFLVYLNQRKNKYGKMNLIYSKSIKICVFEQKYQPYKGGILTGNSYSYYLTDSTAFKKFVGICDDKEVYKFTVVSEDSIKAVKWSWRNRIGDLPEIPIDSVIYSIDKLRQEGIFE